ncbi:MAG: hypothetical protein IKB62_09255 [Oscillospiraceae bacterium]|nr:hypothetical protein [Oscillospiraceae bacterium]
MAFLDNLKRQAERKLKQTAKDAIKKGVNKAVTNIGNKSERIVIGQMPQNLEQFKALPQADMDTPFKTAALAVVALCQYPKDRQLCFDMLEYIKGPAGLSGMDKQFINDRFMDKDYVPRSYFEGAKPENDYKPAEPYTIVVSENPYSYQNEGYATLYIASGGADSPRQVQMRKAKDGKWYLWEQFLLSDIRKPESADPWA